MGGTRIHICQVGTFALSCCQDTPSLSHLCPHTYRHALITACCSPAPPLAPHPQDFCVLGDMPHLQRLEMFHDCPSHLDGLQPPLTTLELTRAETEEVRVRRGGGGQGGSRGFPMLLMLLAFL